MSGYDLGFTVLRGLYGIQLGHGADDRQSKKPRVHGLESTFSAGLSKPNVGGYGVKRLRDIVDTHGKAEPSLSAMLFTALARVNMDHAKDKAAWREMGKVLREELAKALCSKVDEALSASEALKIEQNKLEQQRQAFGAFQADTKKTLAGTLRRAEAAERRLAGAEVDVRRQQASMSNQRRGHKTLLEQHSQLQKICTALQNDNDRLREAHATLQRQANAALSAATDRANAAEAALANTQAALANAQAARAHAAASTVPVPVASQVPAHLRPMASWVEEVVRRTALPLGATFLLDYLSKNRNKAAVERLILKVQAEAMRVMPCVPLLAHEKQRLMDLVRAGPAGWLWSPTMAQGPATPQVINDGTGRASFASATAPPLAPAPIAARAAAPARASASAPASFATPAPAFAPTATTRIAASATATRVAAGQSAYARAMQRLNAGCNAAGRQASHARNATAATATAPSPTPAMATSAPTLPSVNTPAPIPATLAARAVSGGKSGQSDRIGPTSDRSRRRVGP